MYSWLRGIFWVVIGLALGAALGLYLGWVAWPTEFVDADPSILRDDYKQEYTLMIAHAYALDGDLPAAQRRLYSLGGEAPDRWLLTMTVDAILSGRHEETVILPLVGLARDLGLNSPAMAPYVQSTPESGEAGIEDVQE